MENSTAFTMYILNGHMVRFIATLFVTFCLHLFVIYNMSYCKDSKWHSVSEWPALAPV